MSSRFSVWLELLASSLSRSKVKVEFSLEFSMLAQANLRLSSTEYPKMKQARIVAAAIE